MISLSSIIETFIADFITLYHGSILPSQFKALAAMKDCRTTQSRVMLVQCNDCEKQVFVPHSCGNRNCPHCQSHECQQWLERQLKKEVPADYFMLTFTIPKELRSLAWQHQRLLYSIMIQCCWETVKTFVQNDSVLQGNAGAITVLHTHSRSLDYHPHIHLVMPAGAINQKKKLWSFKKSEGKTRYLFNHKALAKVFRAKMLDAVNKAALTLPVNYPKTWVVDCKFVGNGEKALVYLGRYLYKGVIQEKDIITCKDGQVTFRYQDSKSKKMLTRTLPGPQFLRLILQHVLPKGFRRTRNFGFLHPNSKRLIALLQYLTGINPNKSSAWFRERPKLTCKCCGGIMKIIKTMIPPSHKSRSFPYKLTKEEAVLVM
ncbi:IS91 family transposase [Candidatus Scalindua japonica]|uniref:IS91 family transposase n=1 Tax=Candidatus Scalindua japonica TaxID=1284222 RepID=UPI000BDF48CE|nr:transposase [Candidatus Scalindua japonica]